MITVTSQRGCREPASPEGAARREFLSRAACGTAVLVTAWLLRPRAAPAGPVTTDQYGDKIQTLPRGELPEFARGSAGVSSVYRFAIDHAGELEYIPCFCGCKNIGHRSNRDCYIKSFNGDGTVTYTSHGGT